MIDIGPGPMYYMGLAYYWQVRSPGWGLGLGLNKFDLNNGKLATYEGETGRPVKVRFSEHIKKLKQQSDQSPLYKHQVLHHPKEANKWHFSIVSTFRDANLPIVCQSHVPHWTRSNVRDWTRSHVRHRTNLVQY